MHPSSMHSMRIFLDKYLRGTPGRRVLEIGSRDINGSYRPLFDGVADEYTGLDIVPGAGVDIVAANERAYTEIEDASYDVVISGQTFEHARDDQAVMREIARILRPGGYCCIIAPSSGPPHAAPDYRRYQPEELASLAAAVDLVEVESYRNDRRPWHDAVLIAVKPKAVDSPVFPAQAGIQNEEPNEAKPRKRLPKAA